MKIIFKTALKEDQLMSRNQKDIDGVEIQMLDFSDDFSLMKKLTVPVYNIHLPIKEKQCNLSYFIDHINDKNILNVLSVSQGYNANIVIHCDIHLAEVYGKNILNFLEVISKYNVHILLENVMMFEPKNGIDTVLDIPNICTYLNSKLRKMVFYSLLDTCHLMSNIICYFDYPGYSMKSVIDLYNSERFFIHLSSINGDGLSNEPGKHGIDFQNNKIMLHQIINYLKNINYNCNLVLETSETDYINAPNAETLKKLIEEV